MNTVMAVILAIVLVYLLTGLFMFNTAINQLGGREKYIDVFREKGLKSPEFAYKMAKIVVVFSWPWWLAGRWK